MFSTTIEPQKMLVADDHPLFRQALLDNLKPHFPECEWLQAESVDALNKQLENHSDTDVILLDLNIPGAHGFNTLIHTRSHYEHIPVVVISAYEDASTIQQAMSYGASGFIPKSTETQDIVAAIQAILAGETWCPTLSTGSQAPVDSDIATRVASLTQQQHRILMMFADGLLNKQIAYDLGVSEATIKAHATAIFRKLNVRNRTQAVIAISQLGLSNSSFGDASE